MYMEVIISKSNNKNKKYKAEVNGKPFISAIADIRIIHNIKIIKEKKITYQDMLKMKTGLKRIQHQQDL